jgi:hypothetical protein
MVNTLEAGKLGGLEVGKALLKWEIGRRNYEDGQAAINGGKAGGGA